MFLQHYIGRPMKLLIELDGHQEISMDSLGFPGGERHIQLPTGMVSNAAFAMVRAKIQSADDVMDLLLTENALRHRYGK